MNAPSRRTVWRIALWIVPLPPPSNITVAKKTGAKRAPRFRTLGHEGGCSSRPRRLAEVADVFLLFETVDAALPGRLPWCLLALDRLLDTVLVDEDEVVVVPLLLGAPAPLLLGCHGGDYAVRRNATAPLSITVCTTSPPRW